MPAPRTAFDQSAYQVRFDWGTAGLARLAHADIVVVVDVLRFSSTVVRALERGETFAMDAAAHAISINGAPIIERAVQGDAIVLLGALCNASAVAEAVLAEQQRRGRRTSVAVIAAGELTDRTAEATLRFAVEDQLGAGAIIDALSSRGMDHASPEAAIAGESFRALRAGVNHFLSASGSGRELAGRGRAEEVEVAAAVDAASVVPVWRDGVFRAL